MKYLRYFMVVLLVSYLAFMCCGKKESSHTHEGEEQAHTHAGENQPHTHEGEDQAHTHEGEDQAHTHEGEDQAHAHEGEDQAHTHEGEDQAHTHEGETAAAQVHDTEGMITVAGEWEKLIGLETVSAKEMPIELIVSVPGQIIPNQNQVAVVSPFIESSINCLFANIGDKVNVGDPLVCLTSPEIGILRAEYDKAKAELEIAEQSFKRQQNLFQENIISEKSYQEAELNIKVAQVNYNYAMKKLFAMGMTEDELYNPPTEHSDAVGSTIHMHSPISGVITAWDVSLGQKVNSSTQLFEIINLETVWLEADIFEKDLSKIKIGQKIKVRVSAYQDDMFVGKIFYIGNTLNRDTKTTKILVEISNLSQKLKPGMFASTSIVVGEKKNALVIPREAVLEDEHLQVVFVKEPEGYHRHVITPGIISDEYIEILSGLRRGAVVVTKGNFQLKSKLKMAGIDPHAGHSH